MQVKIKRLNSKAVIPTRGTSDSAGMDITATSVNYSSENYVEYKTGLSFEIPTGYVGLLFPRSSISKLDITLANSVGVIDADFRGEVTFRFKACGERDYSVGDKIGQMIIIPYPDIEFIESEELSNTDRGTGSYGSTGI